MQNLAYVPLPYQINDFLEMPDTTTL